MYEAISCHQMVDSIIIINNCKLFSRHWLLNTILAWYFGPWVIKWQSTAMLTVASSALVNIWWYGLSMHNLDYIQTTSLYLRRFLKKLADDQCPSRTKGSIYSIKHISIQPFTMGVDWPEIERLMEVSICFIFAHTAFFLCAAERST